MAVDAGTAILEIDPDVDGLGRKLERDGGSTVSKVAKHLAALFAAGFVIDKAVDFFSGTIAEAREAQKVGAQTAAVIASTGGAARISAQGVGDLAGRLSNLTGIDDEAIQSTENLLLTFTNVRNLGGDNDIFSRATALAMDMSVALGQDASGSAIQLGKALNDPVKGITALQRVGVSFTEDQKKVIKSLVDTGDVAGAQRIILDELAKEFGGSAAAQADPLDRLKVAWQNIQEEIGLRFLPIVEKAATWLADRLPGAMETLIGWARELRGGIYGFIGAFRDGDVTSAGFAGKMERLGVVVREVFGWVEEHRDQIARAFRLWMDTVPVVQMVEHWREIRDAIETTVTWLQANVVPTVRRIMDGAVEQFAHFKAWVDENWPKIEEAIGHVLKVIEFNVKAFIGPFVFVWQHAHDQIMQVVNAVWGQIQLIVSTAVEVIKNVIELVLNVINGDWGAAWENIKAIGAAAWNFIVGTAKFGATIIQAVISGAMSVVSALWSAAWEWIKGVLASAWTNIRTAVSNGIADIVAFMRELPGKAVSAIGDIGSKLFWKGVEALAGMLQGAVNTSFKLAGFISSLPGMIVGWIGEVGGRLYDKGVQLIHGFIQGIADEARKIPGAVTDALSKIPGSPLNAAKALGGLFHAAGGIITKPTLTWVGEGSRPEVIIPLTNPARARQLAWESGLAEMLASSDPSATAATAGPGGPATGTAVNVYGDVHIGSEDTLADLDYWRATRLAGV